MPKNMPETTRFGYNNEEHTRSYSEKISDLRRNDENISDNVKLRDQYFKIIEDTGYSKNRNEEYLNTQVPFSALENRKLEEDMSQEDRAILRQERRDDPTIDDISENEELANYQYHENIKDDFEDILSSIDKDSEEYQDIEKVENLITKLTNSDSIELYEYDDFDITLDNPNLDENVYLQFKGENNNYVIDYQNFVEKNDERLEIDITKDNIEYSELEVEYDKYKDKAINIAEKFPEDVNKIERELENYDFASEKYNEYLKNKYTDFNQYLKDNNISNPYEKYSDDLIKNTKTYSDIRLKMEEIDDEHFSQHGKHVSNYIDYSEEIKSTPQNLQKLKSVELEKNVIGLLPKDQQENNYRETLSRLDKNKSTLKEDLKSYMSNTKIDNAINSVKHHFENIKVKAEDIHNNFKDLGSWNTENKYVKNINDVVDKIKNLTQKNENKLDINDPDLFKKLETKFKESNSFIENIEKTNNIDNQLSNERLKFHENTLKIINPEMESTTNNITSSLSDLSKEDKLNLYNYSKDINSLNLGKNFTEPENIKTAIESQKLINSIENEFGKSTVDESRKEYLVSNTAKPTVNNNFNDNPTLKNFTNNANQFITNIDKNDLKSYQQNCNVEVSKINNNQKSNTLKNNDLLQKYNKQNEPKQQQSNTQEEEQKNEKSIKKGRTHSM